MKNLTIGKKIIFLLMLSIPVMGFAAVNEERNSNEIESTKLSLYVPGFLFKMGSLLANKKEDTETRLALKHMRSVSIVVRDGGAYKEYVAEKKYEKKLNNLEDQNFKPLLDVTSGEENVAIQYRQNKKGTIRQLAVLVNDGEESFVFVRARCNISMMQLKQLLNSESASKKIRVTNIKI